jgi:hypothetical protein
MQRLRISGDQIKEVVQENDWRLIIELKNGRKIVVETDVYPEIRLCNPEKDGYECYIEFTKFLIYERDGDP